MLDVFDLVRTNAQGQGVINILAADKLDAVDASIWCVLIMAFSRVI